LKIKRHIKRDPRKETITFAIVLVIALGLFIYAINYFLSQQSQLSKESTYKTKDLLFTIRMKETSYSVGQPIDLTMEVRNISNDPVVMKFDNNLECDFFVQKEVNLLFAKVPMGVWRYSASIGMKPQRHSITLQPQETKLYNAKWDQKDFNGRQVKPGNYIIAGAINIAGQNTQLEMRGKMNKEKK
jgi:hypothetical protein